MPNSDSDQGNGSDAPNKFVLPERIDTGACGDLAKSLMGLRNGPVVIDASEVAFVSSQGAQLILSVDKTWKEEGVPISYSQPSDAFLADMKTLGVPAEMFEEK